LTHGIDHSRGYLPPVSAGEFTIEFFEDDDGRCPVEEWMDSDVTDLELAALLSGLEQMLSRRGIDVCKTERGQAAQRRALRVPRPPFGGRDRAYVHQSIV
jgi:hypothetical protein